MSIKQKIWKDYVMCMVDFIEHSRNDSIITASNRQMVASECVIEVQLRRDGIVLHSDDPVACKIEF